MSPCGAAVAQATTVECPVAKEIDPTGCCVSSGGRGGMIRFPTSLAICALFVKASW